MSEQPKKKKGGTQIPGPGKRLGRPKKGGEERKAVALSFFKEDMELIETLRKLKYGTDRTGIVRRALREAIERNRVEP